MDAPAYDPADDFNPKLPPHPKEAGKAPNAALEPYVPFCRDARRSSFASWLG